MTLLQPEELKSQLVLNAADEEDFRISMQSLLSLCKTAYGPFGRAKIICTASERPIVTSASSRLLECINISNPLLKVIVGCIKGHAKLYGDGSLFGLVFGLNLIQRSLDSSIKRFSLSDIVAVIAKKCCEYLESSQCPLRVKVDLSSASQMLMVVSTILKSKPICLLSDEETKHISIQILKAFLITIPDQSNSPQYIYKAKIITYPGKHPLDTKLFDSAVLSPFMLEPEKTLHRFYQTRAIDAKLKLILYTVSLTLETLLPSCDLTSKMGVLDESFDKFCEAYSRQVKEQSVDIIACQKTVNSTLKRYLEQKSILVLERLGCQGAEVIQQVSGSSPIDCITTVLASEACGFVDKIEMLHFQGKDFFKLVNKSRPSCTLVVCNLSDEGTSELNVVCRQALDLLYRLLTKPDMMFGGGCSEIHLASFVRSLEKQSTNIAAGLKCSPSHVRNVVHIFAKALESAGAALHQLSDSALCSLYRDNVYCHLWLPDHQDHFPTCACGALHHPDSLQIVSTNSTIPYFKAISPKEPVLNSNFDIFFDEFSTRLNVFRVVSEICSVILKTEHCIVQKY